MSHDLYEDVHRTNTWAADKAAKEVTSLISLMLSVVVSKFIRRRLMMTAVHSTLLHDAEVCADALYKEMFALVSVTKGIVYGFC